MHHAMYLHVIFCTHPSFFFLLSTFYFIFSHITQHVFFHNNIQNITKQNNRHILNISKSSQKGGREGRTTKVTPLYNHVYPSKNTAKHQWSKAWPHQLALLYIHTSQFAGGYGSNMFFYTCVNQFCIIVFFTAVKPANNILFCIELIQKPESSLRRHKLGLTDQSIRSNDDKTRFTCVHRLMTTGHSQNI